MNIYGPSFSSSQVAEAAGMTSSNFRAHLARGNWRIIGKAQPAEALGQGHKFTIYDALGYALAHTLVAHGVDPKVAFERAMYDFAHSSDGGPLNPPRSPGGVFEPSACGATLFVYSIGASIGRCVATKSLRDPIELLFPPMHNRASSAIIVHLNDLRDRVFARLGLDARDYE